MEDLSAVRSLRGSLVLPLLLFMDGLDFWRDDHSQAKILFLIFDNFSPMVKNILKIV